MKTPEDKWYHILVVDDEPTVRSVTKMLLKRDGHEVQTADSGEAALALLENNIFDLIITDYCMAGMLGNQLAAIIKQRWPGQPVIMATANASDFHSPGTPTGGVDCILSKPFGMVELREAIGWAMTRTAVATTTPEAPASPADAPEVPMPNIPPPTAPGESGSRRVRT